MAHLNPFVLALHQSIVGRNKRSLRSVSGIPGLDDQLFRSDDVDLPVNVGFWLRPDNDFYILVKGR